MLKSTVSSKGQITDDAGTLLASEVVWAEVRAHFPTDAEFGRAMDGLGIRFDPCGPEAAAAAGRVWRESRRGAKGPRLRVVGDFLVGAHAQHQTDGLLTRDRGFYRRYFQELRLTDPSSS